MRKYIIAIMLMIASLSAQEGRISVKTDKGTFSVRISGNNGDISATMLSVPENVHKRLIKDIRTLRNEYISKLYSRRDRRQAMAVLDEMEDLINLLYRIGFSAEVNIDDNTEMDDESSEEVMSPSRFNELLSQLGDESFSDDKLEILRSAVKNNYFTIDQLCRIMDEFSMDDDKVKAERIIYPHVVDTENAHKLLSKVTFDDAKKEIRRIIEENN